MGAKLEQRLSGIRQPAIVLQGGAHQLTERAKGGAGRDRIGRIGSDQQCRLLAAPQIARSKPRGISTPNSTVPEASQPVELGLVLDLMRHA